MDESPSRLPMPSQIPKKDGASNKRRSLLLPPGSISGIGTRKGSGSLLSPSEEDPPPPKQRPVTMFGLPGRLQSTKEEDSERESEPQQEEDSRSPSPESKAAARAEATKALMGDSKPRATAVAPKSGIARSTSIRAPITRSAAAKTSTAPASKIGARPVSMIKESTSSSRPQSSASIAPKGTAEAPVSSRLRAPAPSTSGSTGLRRSNTTSISTARHSRTQSALNASTASSAPRTDVRRHPTISEGTTEIKSQLHRPAFNTMQQHYSPKKNLAPKPASSSLIHSQPIETGSSLGLETQLLQTRLLQLSILHRQGEPVYQAWQKSARRALKHKFTDVAADCEIVRAKEKDLRKRANSAALKEWCKGDMALLGENIANLSSVVNEVMSLVEDGGRVHQALEMFEAWITWVEAIYQGREQQGRRHADFIEGLGDGWKSEVSALVRKLQGLSRQLDSLGRVAEGSSLHEIVSGMRALTRGAVEELRAVEGLEAEVVKREARWVDEQVGGMSVEIEALLA